MHERDRIIDSLAHVSLAEFKAALAIQSRGNYLPGTVLDIMRQPAVIEKPLQIAEATRLRKLRRARHMLRNGAQVHAVAALMGLPEDEVEEQQMQVAQAASRTRVQLVRDS